MKWSWSSPLLWESEGNCIAAAPGFCLVKHIGKNPDLNIPQTPSILEFRGKSTATEKLAGNFPLANAVIVFQLSL